MITAPPVAEWCTAPLLLPLPEPVGEGGDPDPDPEPELVGLVLIVPVADSTGRVLPLVPLVQEALDGMVAVLLRTTSAHCE